MIPPNCKQEALLNLEKEHIRYKRFFDLNLLVMNKHKTERFEFILNHKNIDLIFLNNLYRINFKGSKLKIIEHNSNNLKYNYKNIPILKYLGVFLDYRLAFTDHFNHLISWSKRQFHYLKNLIFENIPLKASTIYFIYRSKIRQKKI